MTSPSSGCRSRSSTTTAPRARSTSALTGPGRSTATARLPACQTGCQVETISFGGPSALVEAMHGTATIESFTVDGQRGPGRARRALAGRRRPWSARRRGSVRRRSWSTGTSPCLPGAQLELLRRHQPDRRTRRRAGAVRPDRDPGDAAPDRVVGPVRRPLRPAPAESMPFRGPSGHAHGLHGVRPQHRAGQQHEPGLHLGPRRHPAAGARRSSPPAACPIPTPRRPHGRCSTRTRSPSPCASTSWSPRW